MTLETLFKTSIFRENLQAGEIFTQLQPLDNICTFLEEEVTSFLNSDIAQWYTMHKIGRLFCIFLLVR